MKTAISVPDAVFARAERAAHTLGVSRSEFYARAAERYLDDLDKDDVTARLDAAIRAAAADAEQRELAALGLAHLEATTADDEW